MLRSAMWNVMEVTANLSFENQNTYYATFEIIKFPKKNPYTTFYT